MNSKIIINDRGTVNVAGKMQLSILCSTKYFNLIFDMNMRHVENKLFKVLLKIRCVIYKMSSEEKEVFSCDFIKLQPISRRW